MRAPWVYGRLFVREGGGNAIWRQSKQGRTAAQPRLLDYQPSLLRLNLNNQTRSMHALRHLFLDLLSFPTAHLATNPCVTEFYEMVKNV